MLLYMCIISGRHIASIRGLSQMSVTNFIELLSQLSNVVKLTDTQQIHVSIKEKDQKQ